MSMGFWSNLRDGLERIAKMGGCVCSKETVVIEDVSYRVLERIAEG